MIDAGLDEAALGPRLGPFCTALVCVHSPETSAEETNLYTLFDGVVSRDGKTKGLPAVGDSKVLYTPSAGLERLETGVCTFLHLAGLPLPTTLRSLAAALCPSEDLTAMDRAPWFAESSTLVLPLEDKSLSKITGYAENVAARAKEIGIVFDLPSARLITAKSFNESIEKLGGKGRAVREIISSLMNYAFAAHDRTTGAAGSSPSSLRLTVDRQGGRRYYGEWLAELLPGEPIRAFEEGPTSSKYGVKDKEINFMVGADGSCMEVALASMTAKYLRESAMRVFNRWWADRVDGIRPTAGYPRDANRFIADLDAAGVLPEKRADLIRLL
ncbi:MAG: hypothetical protein RQ801_12760 [Spirochaetaceae bacterium]|nr:hypothetical protein [Spirochaetaceae bacterium]MDT8299171.1 hypothetical protein [Spirochaetaceae bacterium]